MKQSEQINELAAALVSASAEMPAVKKSSVNPHFHSKFASLDAIDAAVRPVLAKHGLVILQGGEPAATPTTRLTTRLLHKSGQWIETTAEARPAKDDAQGVMAVFTYLRRAGYAIAGIVADEDDDGNGACQKPVQPVVKPDAKVEAVEKAKEVTRVPLDDKGQELLSIIVSWPEVRMKADKKGKDRYYAKASDGRFYSTYDKDVAQAMKDLSGQQVLVEYHMAGTFITVSNVSISVASESTRNVSASDEIPF